MPIQTINITRTEGRTGQRQYSKSFVSGDWSSYGHTIRAQGGYWGARFELAGITRAEMDELFMQGLMRTVESRTKDGRKAWEGFISGMQMHLPGITFEVNLKDAFNECFASYTLISSSVLTRTNTQQDDFLQSKYGAKQGPLSIANIQSAGMADQAVTNFLEKYKDPYRLISSFPNSSNTIGMTVFCEGFWHTNFWHIYNQTALATNIGLSDLIKLIISDVTEFVLFEDIASNSTIVTLVYDADRMAGSIMEGLAALGDAGNNRYIIGMTDDRTFYYKQAKPISDEGYSMTATTDPKRISDANGKEVPKPLVRPDNWIRYPDVFPANLGQAGLKMYIESVAYNENADGVEEVGIDRAGVSWRMFNWRASLMEAYTWHERRGWSYRTAH